MTYSLCRPIKMDSVAEGGSMSDSWYTELSPLVDALTALGMYIQMAGASAPDTAVLIDRSSKGLRFTDSVTTHVLGELVSSTSGQVGSHNALLDICHFLADNGPGDGFASGAVCQNTYNGPLLLTSTWYANSSLAIKISSVAYTYSGPLIQSITRTIYNASGVAVRTMVDQMTYSGPLCTGVTRTWS